VIDSNTAARRNGQFPTTKWSQVVAAGNRAAPDGRAALAQLCAIYWYPLYAFIRRRGYNPEQAEDLVQGFFVTLLEKDGLAALDRDRGRFRSFLMATCIHYLANVRDHERALKRGRGRVVIPFDSLRAEGRYRLEPAHELTAERLFERRWATTLLNLVLNRLAAEMSRAGKSRLFEALKPTLLDKTEKVPYASIAAALGCSETAARVAAHRLRTRYRDLLREEVARTLDDSTSIEDEIRDLFVAFMA
jgi:RNA polymerase sigma-70 factor (ECF subfamily)